MKRTSSTVGLRRASSMSRKLNRRQLRQQEELEQLRSVAGEGTEQEQAAPAAADESPAEDEEEERPAPSATGFAAVRSAVAEATLTRAAAGGGA